MDSDLKEDGTYEESGGVKFRDAPTDYIPDIDRGYTGKPVDIGDMGLPMAIITERTGLTKDQVLADQPSEDAEETKPEDKPKKQTSEFAKRNKTSNTPDVYGDKPSMEDQIATDPDSVKFGCTQVITFDLSDNEGIKGYNELLAKEADSNPELYIESVNEQFHAGIFYILVNYKRILYKQ